MASVGFGWRDNVVFQPYKNKLPSCTVLSLPGVCMETASSRRESGQESHVI